MLDSFKAKKWLGCDSLEIEGHHLTEQILLDLRYRQHHDVLALTA
jgi:hypothetical protein